MRSKVLPDTPACGVPGTEDSDLDDVAANGEDIDNIPDAWTGDRKSGSDDSPGVAAGGFFCGRR